MEEQMQMVFQRSLSFKTEYIKSPIFKHGLLHRNVYNSKLPWSKIFWRPSVTNGKYNKHKLLHVHLCTLNYLNDL